MSIKLGSSVGNWWLVKLAVTVQLGVCVCVWERESELVKEREGGEKARQREKVTLPVAQYVIPTGIGV